MAEDHVQLASTADSDNEKVVSSSYPAIIMPPVKRPSMKQEKRRSLHLSRIATEWDICPGPAVQVHPVASVDALSDYVQQDFTNIAIQNPADAAPSASASQKNGVFYYKRKVPIVETKSDEFQQHPQQYTDLYSAAVAASAAAAAAVASAAAGSEASSAVSDTGVQDKSFTRKKNIPIRQSLSDITDDSRFVSVTMPNRNNSTNTDATTCHSPLPEIPILQKDIQFATQDSSWITSPIPIENKRSTGRLPSYKLLPDIGPEKKK